MNPKITFTGQGFSYVYTAPDGAVFWGRGFKTESAARRAAARLAAETARAAEWGKQHA